MVKFSGAGENKDGKERKFVGLGITIANIQRMLNGDPIHVNCDELGVEGVDILIFAGKTEFDIEESLRKGGLDIKHQRIDFKLLQERARNKKPTTV